MNETKTLFELKIKDKIIIGIYKKEVVKYKTVINIMDKEFS